MVKIFMDPLKRGRCEMRQCGYLVRHPMQVLNWLIHRQKTELKWT